MPYARMYVTCAWCQKDTSITFGNPDMKTQPQDSPFVLTKNKNGDPEVLFMCPSDDCKKFAPKGTTLPTRSI